MGKWRVVLETSASAFVEVEAESAEDAITKAVEEGGPGICAQCSGWGRSHGLALGEEWKPSEYEPATPIEDERDG